VLKYTQAGIDPTPAPTPVTPAPVIEFPVAVVEPCDTAVVWVEVDDDDDVVVVESFCCMAVAVFVSVVILLRWSSRVSPETNETDETVDEAEGDEPINNSDWKSWGVWWNNWRVGGSWVKICPKDGKRSDSNRLSWEDKNEGNEEEADEDAPEIPSASDWFEFISTEEVTATLLISSPLWFKCWHQEGSWEGREEVEEFFASKSICCWSWFVKDS
jgi:hypothetical protein